MFAVTAVCVLVCLSAGVTHSQPLHHPGELPEFLPRQDPQAADPAKARRDGVDVIHGELTLAFGAVRLPLGRDAEDAVRFLQLLLAGGVADAAGLLLALVWTAGFLPGFLDPGAAAVLLAKPVPRWSLLAGKYLGVVAFVGFQAAVFVFGTWLALGLRTGVWHAIYLMCLPVLLLHFAVFFSVSVLLAVTTRNTVACVFGSILFWFLCWGMNYGRHAAVGLAEPHPLPGSFGLLLEGGYWVLPKPADLGVLLFEGLQADGYFGRFLEFQAVRDAGAFYPELSVLSSVLFAAAVLALAAREFVTTDY
jgi:hypothetical protein